MLVDFFSYFEKFVNIPEGVRNLGQKL